MEQCITCSLFKIPGIFYILSPLTDYVKWHRNCGTNEIIAEAELRWKGYGRCDFIYLLA